MLHQHPQLAVAGSLLFLFASKVVRQVLPRQSSPVLTFWLVKIRRLKLESPKILLVSHHFPWVYTIFRQTHDPRIGGLSHPNISPPCPVEALESLDARLGNAGRARLSQYLGGHLEGISVSHLVSDTPV